MSYRGHEKKKMGGYPRRAFLLIRTTCPAYIRTFYLNKPTYRDKYDLF